MHSLADHSYFMEMAIKLAQKASSLNEVPVGAVVVSDDAPSSIIVSEAFNNRESQSNPLGHAELLAIDKASKKLGRWRLSGCTLYVTLEPCLMCAGAIILSRVDRVVYGAKDPKAGAVSSLYQTLSDQRLNHRPEVISGIREEECSKLLKDFFKSMRAT